MDSKELLEKICEEVRFAAMIILDADRSPEMIDSKEGHSNFVTVYDKKVQEELQKGLNMILPEAHFIGEEDDIHEEGLPDGYVFIVDPIDGTTNFIKDLHASTISVALLKDNQQYMGIIYNPYSDEMFTAIKGEGAFLNGKAIHVSNSPLKDGIVEFGTAPYYAEFNKKSMDMAQDMLHRCIDIRRGGAATIDLVNVACGRAEMYFEMRLQPWDHAAGSLIVREAGGIVTTFEGEETCYDKPISILATNAVVRGEIEHLHRNIIDKIKERKVYTGIYSLPNGHAKDILTHGCICLEGGAFRGLYGEGVLDALMENDINFDCVIGVSAGALNGMNYTSGQIGRSARANLRYRHDQRYVGGRAFIKSISPLNLDFLFNEASANDPFDEDAFYDERRRFIAVATDYRNGEIRYFEKGKCEDIISAIKASASLPYMTKPVMVDGIPCLDGGCRCKIPYQWALDNGYEKIVIVKTREREYRRNEKEGSLNLAKKYYHRTPKFAEILAESNHNANLQCDEIDELEKSGRVFVIAPSDKVTVTRLEPDMEKLGELYYLGYEDMKNELDRLKEYLNK